MRILVMGAGAIGGNVGAPLARAGLDVTLLDQWPDHVEAMKTNTRRYAKRQLTWLRKLPGAHLVDLTDRTPEDVAAELVAMI